MRRLLERIGLDRPETRAWAMYDWANSAFQCTIITAVFPVYYGSVAAAGLPGATATARFATATTVALTIIALASPILGAYADFAGAKKRMLASFMAIGVTATAAMFFIDQGEWRLALALFVIANIGDLRQLRLLRFAPAAHRVRQGDGPRLQRRVCARVPRRRPAAGAESALDHAAACCSGCAMRAWPPACPS